MDMHSVLALKPLECLRRCTFEKEGRGEREGERKRKRDREGNCPLLDNEERRSLGTISSL